MFKQSYLSTSTRGEGKGDGRACCALICLMALKEGRCVLFGIDSSLVF